MTVNPYRPAPPVHRGRWEELANCATTDPELFFSPGPGGQDPGRIAKAKQVCRGCVVIAECLEASMTEPRGIAGGLTANERRLMRKAS
jgi:WhiB family redox-sensing transcriptional regulator